MNPQQLFKFLIALAVSGALTSCNNKEELANADVLVSAMDTSANPGSDFFKFAHGSWARQNPIPESENSWGIHLEVRNEIYKRLLAICDSAATKPGGNKSIQMIGALWATGMDSLGLEKQGIAGLQPYFEKINAIRTKKDLPGIVAELHTMGVSAMFNVYVSQDDKNSEQYALFIAQGGLGLPDRDYYFNKDSRTANIRKEYVRHITKMLVLAGHDSILAGKKAETIMEMETSLAKASRKLEDLRDPYKNYNKFAVSDLSRRFKGIDWNALFEGMGIQTDTAIVGQPEFLVELERIMREKDIEVWKSYLSWHLLRNYSHALSHNFVRQHFYFYGTIMNGQKQMRPRWKRILDAEETYLGDLLGQEFVKNYFPEKTKQRYIKLVDEMIIAYREHIEKLDWMSDSTKQKALVKLSTIRKKVGYPEKWKDYNGLTFTRDSYLNNIIAGEKWFYRYYMDKLHKPVDRNEWHMTPQTWNAYYNPSNNEIVLPAAIFMIPGLHDEDADDAIVYGYGGASTIGHELTHGFDDQGSQYDAEGNLKNWWTKKDRRLFEEKVNGIVNQFDNYVVLDSMKINGRATAGENIADLGGVMIALDAYKKTDEYKANKKIGGLTPLQRYFLGYALSWKIISRDERLAQQVMSDVHSPPFLRVNGPLANVPEFYEAFNVQPGQPMWRADSVRVKIW